MLLTFSLQTLSHDFIQYFHTLQLIHLMAFTIQVSIKENYRSSTL